MSDKYLEKDNFEWQKVFIKKNIMKRTIVILSILFMGAVSQAQEQKNMIISNRNTGLFGILQASYIKNYNAYRIISGSDGVQKINLKTTGSNTYSLNAIFGYFVIPKRLSIGVGFGLDGYHNPDINTAPLYGDIRFYFTSERNIPYIYVDYGGLIQLGQEFHKGQVGRIGIGYKFFVSKKLCLVADVSFAAKSISYSNDPVLKSDDAVFIKGIGFTLGFLLF